MHPGNGKELLITLSLCHGALLEKKKASDFEHQIVFLRNSSSGIEDQSIKI